MRIPDYYSEFLRKTRNYQVGDLHDLIDRSTYISKHTRMDLSPSNKFAPASYILDYTQKKYIYANNKVTQFIDKPISYFLDGGVDFAVSCFHKQDLKVYSENVLSENVKFLKNIPTANHADYLFTCNYRVKDQRGEYKNIVQQSIFIKSAENGMPLAALGFLFDISNYRNDSRILHTIEPLNNADFKTNRERHLVKNTFFADERDKILTKREIEILKYLCDDLDSLQIASKMNISKHTVDNHRRNMLQKTNSKTSIGLVRFAFTEGYI